jgi:hypothetical protein
MGDCYSSISHQLDIRLVHPNAVGGKNPAIKHTVVVENPGNGLAEPSFQIRTFLLSFRKMKVEDGVERAAQVSKFGDRIDT